MVSSFVRSEIDSIQYRGISANRMYTTSTSVRVQRRSSRIAVSRRSPAAPAHATHPVIENEAQQQDDQEVDEREGGRRAEVELSDRLLRQVLAQESRRIAGTAAGQHERFGVDHEAVHETQQHRTVRADRRRSRR